MFTSPSQIICTVFGVHIYYYGVILALAIMAGTLISEYISEKFYKLKKDTIIDNSQRTFPEKHLLLFVQCSFLRFFLIHPADTT